MRFRHFSFLLLSLFPAACSQYILPDTTDHVGKVEETEVGSSFVDLSECGIGTLSIETKNNIPITTKEQYIECTVELDGGIHFGQYAGKAKIRGRGNSTWGWYPKKPYRLKLDEKSSLMGLAANRDWALMADYRDPTHMMNMAAFAMGHYLDMPFTNHYKYVRLTLNGEYMGLYMITEHIEQGKTRVNIDKETGYLFNFDLNDGPYGSPNSGDSFFSQLYSTEVGIKWPEDPTPEQLEKAKADLAVMEKAVYSHNLADIRKNLDMQSAVNVLMIHEITQNIDFCNTVSFHSVPVHKVSADTPWAWGPLWDFDSGFSLDVNNHTRQGFFLEYKKLQIGTDPYVGTNANCGRLPRILGDLFMVPEFVNLFKETWKNNKDGMLEYVLSEIDKVSAIISEAAYEDYDIWGISAYMDYKEQVELMKTWLVNRFNYLDTIIPKYPVRGVPSSE